MASHVADCGRRHAVVVVMWNMQCEMATEQEIEIAARALCRARNLNPDILGLDGKTPIWAGALKEQARIVLEAVESFRQRGAQK